MTEEPKGGCPKCGCRYVVINIVETFTVTTEFNDEGKLVYPDTSKGGDQEYESVFCEKCRTKIEDWELEDS